VRPDLISVYAQARERAAKLASTSPLPICKREEQLTTPAWKIGHKKTVWGPPGFAPPVGEILNSEGDEIYFSCKALFECLHCILLHDGLRNKFILPKRHA